MVEDILLVHGLSRLRILVHRARAAAILKVEAEFVGRQPKGSLVVLRRDFDGRLPGPGRGRGRGFLTFSRINLGRRLSRPPGLSKPERPHSPQLDALAGVNALAR